MATITQLPSGNWRVQVRRKQSYASETFRRHVDAKRWALAAERGIDLGEAPMRRAQVDPTTFEHSIDLHVDDMREVGKAPRPRSASRGREQVVRGRPLDRTGRSSDWPQRLENAQALHELATEDMHARLGAPNATKGRQTRSASSSRRLLARRKGGVTEESRVPRPN